MNIVGRIGPLSMDGGDQLLLAFLAALVLPLHLEGPAADQGEEFFVRDAPVMKFLCALFSLGRVGGCGSDRFGLDIGSVQHTLGNI